MSDISDISDISDEYLDNYNYTHTSTSSSKSSDEFDTEFHDNEKQKIKEDYEEERPKSGIIYSNLLKRYQAYQIDFDIKTTVAKKIRKFNTMDKLNHTLLIASIVILTKNGNKIDMNFSKLCDEVIETVVKWDINLENKNNKIDQLKRDLLRYCRFVQRCIG
jgi:hypothetical protein